MKLNVTQELRGGKLLGQLGIGLLFFGGLISGERGAGTLPLLLHFFLEAGPVKLKALREGHFFGQLHGETVCVVEPEKLLSAYLSPAGFPQSFHYVVEQCEPLRECLDKALFLGFDYFAYVLALALKLGISSSG